MKLVKIEVKNFRLLENFTIDIEDELSLVIGKNNVGKTSLLSVMDKFLNPSENRRFTLDDFNINFRKKLLSLVHEDASLTPSEQGIKMNLYIKYTEDDDLSNISRLMMDLDPLNNYIVLGFGYIIDEKGFDNLKKDFSDFNEKEAKRKEEQLTAYKEHEFTSYVKEHMFHYFRSYKKSIACDKEGANIDEKTFLDIDDEHISINDVINFKYISAKREVSNRDVDKTLSNQTSKIYKKAETNDEQNSAIEEFKESLISTDATLSNIYQTLFSDIINKVKCFGGYTKNESIINIKSTLQHRELLEGNTTVIYQQDGNSLPENYNGLGYMNLISIIFEIEILLHEFKREKEKRLSDINLLFIEEPEAHTHPQMQHVFIKNIKKLLGNGIQKGGIERKLQYIISTHSSHIVADSDFDDIKYLKKEEKSNSVIAKNIRDLEIEYGTNPKLYQFLKQYLTLSRAELFFADKAILIEGDTERILVPAFMKKIDLESDDESEKMLSQNISIIEVGAYSEIFDLFIAFIGIKTLIITDLDAIDALNKACKVDEGVSYSNNALKHYYNKQPLNDLRNREFDQKQFNYVEGKWIPHRDGDLCIVYQNNEDGYCGRSFEDSFFKINRTFMLGHIDTFKGLKNLPIFREKSHDSYRCAQKCVKKKTHLALDILYHSDENYSNWEIPKYIKEGLIWLRDK